VIGNALLAACVLLVALLFWLMEACRFLIPYRALLWREYGLVLTIWAAVLFLNLFGWLYLASRAFFLKGTGRKLAHLEKQVRAGRSVVEDLAQRLED